MSRFAAFVARLTFLVDAFLPTHVLKLPASALRRIRLSVGTALLLLVLNLTLSPLMYLATGTVNNLKYPLFATPPLLGCILAARRSRSQTLPGTLVSVPFLILTMVASTEPGAQGVGAIVCLIVVPTLATLLAGNRMGLLSTAVALGWLVARIVAIAGRMPATEDVELWVVMCTAWMTPAASGLAWLYEVSRRKAEDALEERAGELAKANTELARSNRELALFASIASHDLQEPLRMVASYTQLLARRYRGALDADADEFIGHAVGGVKRMERIVEDLLEYSRVGAQLSLARVDAGRALARVLQALEASVDECGAQVSVEALPVVKADEAQLERLFQNLVENALKFRTPQRPLRIHVRARRQEKQWVFSVQDNGIGIEPQYFERIFIIFQRLHHRDEYPGTGVGLAVCQRIVERHGGHIWVEATPGEGSTFFFSLRAAD